MPNLHHPASGSFREYLLGNRRNKIVLILSAIAILLQFSVFKYYYPFASFIHGDSFSYLEAAYYNKGISTYMIGYSMFIRVFSVFTNSDTALTAFQYLFVEASGFFLLFTLFFFYRPAKGIRLILLLFLVFNPLFLYLGNLVSSDALFLGLSLDWFTLLLWIIYRSSLRLILWHTLVLYLAFTVRYNALIYLLISTAAFVLSRQSLKMKTVGIAAATLAIGLFIWNTGNQYKTLTGSWQYSPFAGWQWANNAMYAYRYVDSAERLPVAQRFQALDNNIRRFYDTTRDLKKHPEESVMASTFYMWSPSMPLFNYRNALFKKDSTASELKKWASMGPLYKSYGIYIIKKYPIHFLRYFLWPNTIKYYAPPVEFLEEYDSGKDDVAPIAQKWFGYKTNKVFTRAKGLEKKMLAFYPILSGMINVILFLSLVSFFLLDGQKQRGQSRDGILLAGIVWLLNAAFTIFASSAALRFQSFPLILSTLYAGILLDWITKMALSAVPTSTISDPSFLAINFSKK